MVRWCFCCYCCCCCCWKVRARYCVTAPPRHRQGSAVGGWSGRLASLLRSLHAHDHDHSSNEDGNSSNKSSSSPGVPGRCTHQSTPCSPASVHRGPGSCSPAPPHRRAVSLHSPLHGGLQNQRHHSPRHYGSASDLLVTTTATHKDNHKRHRASICTCVVETHIESPWREGIAVGKRGGEQEPPTVVVLATSESKEDSGRRYTALLSGLDRIKSRLTGSSSSKGSSDKRREASVDPDNTEQDKPRLEDVPLYKAHEEVKVRSSSLSHTSSPCSVADRSSARDSVLDSSSDSEASTWCGREGSIPRRLWRHYSSTKASGDDPRRRQRRSSGGSVVSEGRGRPGVGEGVGRVLSSTLGQWRRLQGSVGNLTATLRRHVSQEHSEGDQHPQDQCSPNEIPAYHRLQEGHTSSSVALGSQFSQGSSHGSNDSSSDTPQEEQLRQEGGVVSPPAGENSSMSRRSSDSSYCEGEPLPKRMSLANIKINNNNYSCEDSDVSSEMAASTASPSLSINNDPVIVTHTIETSFLTASPPPGVANTPESTPSGIPLTSSRQRFFQEMTRADSLCETRNEEDEDEGRGGFYGDREEGRHMFMTGTATTICRELEDGMKGQMGEESYLTGNGTYNPVGEVYGIDQGENVNQHYDSVSSPGRASPFDVYNEDNNIEGAHPSRENLSPRTRSNITIQFAQAMEVEEEETRKRKQTEDHQFLLLTTEEPLSIEDLEIHALLEGSSIPDDISDAFNRTADEILSGEEDIPVFNISTHPLIAGGISEEGSTISDINKTTDIVEIIHSRKELAYDELDTAEAIANVGDDAVCTTSQLTNSKDIADSSPENKTGQEGPTDHSHQTGSSLLTEVLELVMTVPTNENVYQSTQSEQLTHIDETHDQLDNRLDDDIFDRTRHSDNFINLNESYTVLEFVKSDDEILDTSKSDVLLDTTKSDEELLENSKSDDNLTSSKSDERLMSLKSDDLLVSSKSDDGYPDTMKSDCEFRELLDTTKSEDELADTTKSDEILDTTKSEDLLDTTKSDSEIEHSDVCTGPNKMDAHRRAVAWKVLSGMRPLPSATGYEDGMSNTPPWSPSCHSEVISGEPSSCSSPIQQQATYMGEASSHIGSHIGSFPNEVIRSSKHKSIDSLVMEVDDPGGGSTNDGARKAYNREGATAAESGAMYMTAASSVGGSEGPRILITPVCGGEGACGGFMSSGTTPTIVVESGSGGSLWGSNEGATALSSHELVNALAPINLAAHLAANPRPPKPKSPITVDEWVAALPLLGSCNVGQEEEEEEAWGGGGGSNAGVSSSGTVTYHLDDFNLGAEAGLMAGSGASNESQDGQHPSTSTPVTSKIKSRTSAGPTHLPPTPKRSRPLTLSDIPRVIFGGGPRSPGGPSSLSGGSKWANIDSRRLQFSSKQASFQSEISALSLQSTKSSIDSLLESRAPDPIEVLLNLGFGKSDQEGIERIPQRFLKPSEVPGNDIDDFMKSEDDFSDRVESEMVLGLNPQVTRRTSVATSPLLLQVVDKVRKSRSEHRLVETAPTIPEPRFNGKDKFSSLIKNVRDMNRGCTGFREVVKKTLSVLNPENRRLLDLQGQRSPEPQRKRLVIGQQSFDLGKDGELLEHEEKDNFDKDRSWDEDRLAAEEVLDKEDENVEQNEDDEEDYDEYSSMRSHPRLQHKESVFSMASSATSIDSSEEEMRDQRHLLTKSLHAKPSDNSPPGTPPIHPNGSLMTLHESKRRQEIIRRLSRPRTSKLSISSVDERIPEDSDEEESDDLERTRSNIFYHDSFISSSAQLTRNLPSLHIPASTSTSSRLSLSAPCGSTSHSVPHYPSPSYPSSVYPPSQYPALPHPLTLHSSISCPSSPHCGKNFSGGSIYPPHYPALHSTKRIKDPGHTLSSERRGSLGGGGLKRQQRIDAGDNGSPSPSPPRQQSFPPDSSTSEMAAACAMDGAVCGPLCRSGSAQSDSSGFMEGEQAEGNGDLRTAAPQQTLCASLQHLQSRRPAIMGSCDSWWWSRESGNSMDTVLYGPVRHQQQEGGQPSLSVDHSRLYGPVQPQQQEEIGTWSLSVDHSTAASASIDASHSLHCPAASTTATASCWTSQSYPPTVGDTTPVSQANPFFCSCLTSWQNNAAAAQSSCMTTHLSLTSCRNSLHRSLTPTDNHQPKVPLYNRRRHSLPDALILSSLSSTTSNPFSSDSCKNLITGKPLSPIPDNTQKFVNNPIQNPSHNTIYKQQQFMNNSEPSPQGKALRVVLDSSPSAFRSVNPSISSMSKLLSTTNSGDNGWSGADSDAWPPKLHSQQPTQCAAGTTVGPVLGALRSYRQQLYRQELLSRHLQESHDSMDPAGAAVVASASRHTQLAASVAAIRTAIQTEVDQMEQLLLAPAPHHNLGPDTIINIVSQMVCLLHKQTELCMDLETLAISTQDHRRTQNYGNPTENGTKSQHTDNNQTNTQMNGLNQVFCDSLQNSKGLVLTTLNNNESCSSEIHKENLSSNQMINNSVHVTEDKNGNNISTSITSDYTSSVISSIIDHSSSVSMTSIDNPQQPVSSSQAGNGTMPLTAVAMHPPPPSLVHSKRNEPIVLTSLENNWLPKLKDQVGELVSVQTQEMKERLDQNSEDMKDIKRMIELLLKQQNNNS